MIYIIHKSSRHWDQEKHWNTLSLQQVHVLNVSFNTHKWSVSLFQPRTWCDGLNTELCFTSAVLCSLIRCYGGAPLGPGQGEKWIFSERFGTETEPKTSRGCKPISSSWSRAIIKLTLVTTPLTCNGCNCLQLSQHTVAAVNCVIEEQFHMVAMLFALLHPITVRCQLSTTLELDPVKKG